MKVTDFEVGDLVRMLTSDVSVKAGDEGQVREVDSLYVWVYWPAVGASDRPTNWYTYSDRSDAVYKISQLEKISPNLETWTELELM